MTTTSTRRTSEALFRDDEFRVDGHEKVSGQMRYTADIAPADLLWAAFTTSPYAHAKIVRIDTTAAKAVPGVRAVLTAADIGPGKRSGRMLFDYPVLAYEKAIMVGDRVAAVAAETREAAEEAARLVEVEYEELPAVLDPFAALAPDAPVVHPERATYHYLRQDAAADLRIRTCRAAYQYRAGRRGHRRGLRARAARASSTAFGRRASTPAISSRKRRSSGSTVTGRCTSRHRTNRPSRCSAFSPT